MKKIVFVPVRMKDDYRKVHWPVSGNTSFEYPPNIYLQAFHDTRIKEMLKIFLIKH